MMLLIETRSLQESFIKGFLDQGYKYAHLDGGNRCDTFDSFGLKTELGEVKISKGDYRFQPDEDGYRLMVTVEKDMPLEDVEKNHPELYKKLMSQPVHLWVYSDLSQEERGDFFQDSKCKCYSQCNGVKEPNCFCSCNGN